VDAQAWDARYADAPLLWSATPNRWVATEARDLPPGRALDVAAGEGRNALWLAERGFSVTAVDFSSVALDRGRLRAADLGDAGDRITWVQADVLDYRPPSRAFGLVVIAYLQLVVHERRTAIGHAVDALADGGVLLFVAHALANLTCGTGGPQDAAVLYRPEDVVDDIRSTGRPVRVVRADEVHRPVDGADRAAVDVLVRVQALREAEFRSN
jgi:SAM-dependent methyltransferase